MLLTGLMVAPSWCPSLSMFTVGVGWCENQLDTHEHASRFVLDDPTAVPIGKFACTECGYVLQDTEGAHAQVAKVLQEIIPAHVYSDWGSKYLFRLAAVPPQEY